MKTRAEIMKERAEKAKQGGAEAPSKPAPRKVFDCKPCGATCVVDECTKRSNGHIECKECGAPHHPDDVRDAGDVPPLEPSKKPAEKPSKTTADLAKETEAKEQKREEDKAARLPTPPDKFCGQCGKILTWAPGIATSFFSCGHNKDEHGIVDDPKHSTNALVAAMAKQEPEFRTGPAPEITIPMVRLNVQWGKARCPVDRFNSFEVGGFSISLDVPVTENLEATGKRLLSDLEKIAEESFKRQRAWYEKKLKDLGVGDE